MIRAISHRLWLAVLAICGAASAAGAQPIGTYSWQLAPYCNVITVNVTQNGSTYTLDGYDTQCGGTNSRAPVTGMAVPNPNGTIELGFTIVTSPSGTPVHVDTAITLATLGGTWRDSLGNTGSFVFTPVGAATGNPRPEAAVAVPDGSITRQKLADGAVDASKIDTASVQQRIQGSCPAGQLMVGVQQSGAVTCEAVSSGSGGDITAVTAGTGLSGGGVTGDLTLSVRFNGSGSANAAARSDHTHAIPGAGNVGVGEQAGANGAVQSTNVTAVGYHALASIRGPDGTRNTALGALALESNTTGATNVAVGDEALRANLLGSDNTALGSGAIAVSVNSLRLTGVGAQALGALTTGVDTTAVGYRAGFGGGTANVAIGSRSLSASDTSLRNTAVGAFALELATENNNTAIGAGALESLVSGSGNLALGEGAGTQLATGSNNIYLEHSGTASESSTIRVGSSLHTRFFAAGVRNVTTGANNAVAVVIDANGQLGTVSSSRRTKFDIQDLAGPVVDALHRLRPVQFRYRDAFADGSTPIQFGLIAEEVQDVMPELVATDADGQPATVKYHVLPGLLLADVQRLERARAEQAAEIRALREELAAVRHQLSAVVR